MVHNLRARNVCGTSTKSKNQEVRRHAHNSSEIAGDATPLTIINDFNKDFQASNLLHSTILPVKLGILFESSVSAKKKQTKPIMSDFKFDLPLITTAVNPENGNLLNSSRYQANIQAAVDEIILKNTYKRRGGISLDVVKKHLNDDYNYKRLKFNKIVPKYISNSISSGKFRQITGPGARGTFRLSETMQKDVLEEKYRYLHISSRSVIIKRFKRNDLSNIKAKSKIN